MAYEITRQIRASTGFLADKKTTDNLFVAACGRKAEVLAAIRDANLTAKEGEIMSQMLAEPPWPQAILTELQTALASRINATVTAKCTSYQFQDSTNIAHYYPIAVWRSEDSLIERLAQVLDIPCGLGLQKSSGSSVQCITAVYLCVAEGCVTKASNQSPDNKLTTLRYVKTQLKKRSKTKVALPSLMWLLPRRPLDLGSGLYENVYAQHLEPVDCPIDPARFTSLVESIPMRSSNIAVRPQPWSSGQQLMLQQRPSNLGRQPYGGQPHGQGDMVDMLSQVLQTLMSGGAQQRMLDMDGRQTPSKCKLTIFGGDGQQSNPELQSGGQLVPQEGRRSRSPPPVDKPRPADKPLPPAVQSAETSASLAPVLTKKKKQKAKKLSIEEATDRVLAGIKALPEAKPKKKNKKKNGEAGDSTDIVLAGITAAPAKKKKKTDKVEDDWNHWEWAEGDAKSDEWKHGWWAEDQTKSDKWKHESWAGDAKMSANKTSGSKPSGSKPSVSKAKATAKANSKPSVSVEASRQQVRIRIGDGSSFAKSFKDGANGGKEALVKWCHKYIEKLK